MFSELTEKYYNSKILVIFVSHDKEVVFRLSTYKEGLKNEVYAFVSM